nr:hypothetical protein [Tanacetum cinerariifolium]
MIKVLPPKTAKEVVARENKRKDRTTLLMALPEDHLAKFHNMANVKEMWEAIKSRFGGNDESNKMQKYLLKHQFEGFSVSTSEGYKPKVSKVPTFFLVQVALIMRTKPGLDTFSFDDLYNNLRVFERDVKGTTVSSSSNTQNVAFVSADNTSSTDDVSTAYSVFSPSVSKSQKEGSASYTDEVAMISMRIKKIYKRTGRKLQFDTRDIVGFDKTKVECFNFHKMRHFARDYRAKWNQDSRRRDEGYNGNKARDNSKRRASQDDSKALVTIDGEAIDCFFIIAVQTFGSGISILLAVGTPSTGSGNLYCQWELSPSSGNALCILFPTKLYKENHQFLKFKTVLITSSRFLWNSQCFIAITWCIDDHIVFSKLSTVNEFDSSLPIVICFGIPTLYYEAWLAMDDPHKALKGKGIIDSGCSRHMIGNKAHLADYQEFKGGFIAFGGGNGKITDKGTIKASRQHNMYSFNLKNIDPSGDLSCLFAKASIDESNKWHRRLGYVNFKNLNKLVKENLIRGLPSKIFDNDHIYVACQKGKQHKASFKAKIDFIRQAENQFNHKVKTIRSDNETEFKNHDLIEFCGLEWIKREYSNARTPQQNRVAKRKNITLIKAAKTMLADSFLPTTFWGDAVNTACYVLNRVLVTKPQNKTPYELLTGKFDGKSDLGFLVGYSQNSKAFRVYNLETKRVVENLHVNFLENKPNVAGKGHAWMFDLDYLTNSMNYESKEIDLHDEHFILSIWSAYSTTVKSSEERFKRPLIASQVRSPLSARFFTDSSYDAESVVTDFNNLETTVNVSPTPITRIHTIHPKTQILGDPLSAIQTRSKVHKNSKAHALPLVKDEEVVDVDVYLYRFQVTPKTSHLQAMKRIFRYLKGQPKLGRYPKVSSFDLDAYSNSDYAGANLNRKSTTEGCQFLGKRLILWQCKKQTIVATSTTEVEYVAAAHCCG